MPLIDLYADSKPNGYTGRIRIAESTNDGYKFRYQNTKIIRLTKQDAMDDARQLAQELATENNMQVVKESERTLVIR